MGWNEPENKDPWGSSNNRPPDIDQLISNLLKKINQFFGGNKNKLENQNTNFIVLVFVISVLGWFLSGIYIIDPAERGVVTRFGKYIATTLPGPHWHFPYPIEDVIKVDVDRVQSVEVGYTSTGRSESSVLSESLMLTQDENIVDVRLAVQYKIKDARDYLFNVDDPEGTLRQAAESSVREVVGKSKMDYVITEGRTEVALRLKESIQDILDKYYSGLVLTTVNLVEAQAPDEVQDAFADAIKAREDEQRFKNEAEAYANEIIPRARGEAARIIEEASAYKDSVISRAEGEARRFTLLHGEYEKAPDVTRDRIYLDMIENVLSQSDKVLIDVDNNNILYLSFDSMNNKDIGMSANKLAEGSISTIMEQISNKSQENVIQNNIRMRSNLRNREER